MSPIRFRHIMSFGIVGILATITHAVVAIALVRAQVLHPFPANATGFATGFLVSYFGHHRFSFESDARHKEAMPRFLLVAGFGLVLNQAIVFAFVNLAGLSYYLALAVIILTVPPLSFYVSRHWAFVAR